MARVVLADDDPVLLTLIARLLRSAGHTVFTAADGAACLALAEAEQPDLVVCDVMMPELDGYELARALRAQPATRGARILLLTSGPRGPDRAKALAAGADDFDVKTVNAGRLLARVEGLLARPAAPEDNHA